MPLVHPPGHVQADFGEAVGVISGIERKIHFFAMDLPHSDAIFMVAYPAETTKAFCYGHGRPVRLGVTARRFRRDAVLCGHSIFTERFDRGCTGAMDTADHSRIWMRFDNFTTHIGTKLKNVTANIKFNFTYSLRPF